MSDSTRPPHEFPGAEPAARPAGPRGEGAPRSSTLQSPDHPSVPDQGGGSAPIGAPHLSVVAQENYVIDWEFARGGIGRILRARDRRLDRSVALKEMRVPGGLAEERFVAEALVTARLQHPSIVPIYEAGRWPTGEPFYAMKLVSGRSLAEVIEGTRTLQQRLALLPHVLAVAEAVAYAHSERIIHRDLKPANVLVGEFGETVVIDWGLAKDLAKENIPLAAPFLADVGPVETDSKLTVAGSVLGTPEYMPPEQAAGEPVDERADVYALGAILYHVLAGRSPYDGGGSTQVIEAVIADPPVPLAQRQQGIPEELLTIVTKAMAREPAHRYPNAKELAEELRRFQTGQIVAAHQYSRRALLRRFVRRHRAAVLILAGALVGVMGVGAVSLRRILTERDRAEQKQIEAEAARREAVERADELTLVQARTAVERNPNEALNWLRSLSSSFTRWGAARIIAADAKARGLATVLRGHTQGIDVVAFSPDGRWLASCSDDHSVRLWDLSGRTVKVLTGHTDEVWQVAFSPGGLLLASAGKDASIRLWNVATGAAVRVLFGHTGEVSRVLFLRDGRRLLSTSYDGKIRLWDLASNRSRVLSSHEGRIGYAVLSPDERWVASVGLEDGTLRLTNLETGEVRIHREPQGTLFTIAFSPRGDLVALGAPESNIRLWEVATGTVRTLSGHTRLVTSLAFSPDGRQLASLSQDRTLRLWEVATGAVRIFEGHPGLVAPLIFSPDGRWLASGGGDHLVRLRDLTTHQEWALTGGDAVLALAFSPGGRVLAAGDAEGVARLYPVSLLPNDIMTGHQGLVSSVDFSPGGQTLVSSGADKTVRLWSLVGAEPVVLKGHTGGVLMARFSPDGARVASADRDGTIRLWSTTGQALQVFTGGQVAELCRRLPFAFSPDGSRLAAAGPGSTVRLVDLATGQERALAGHGRPLCALTFSPDGQALASASEDRTVRWWNLATGESQILRGHDGEVVSVAFSSDGRTLASGGTDHTVRFWDSTGRELKRIDVGGGGVADILLSPDGRSLVTRSAVDNNVRRWDVATGQLRRLFQGHTDSVMSIRLSPEGRRLATASTDGTVRLWDLETGESRTLHGDVREVYSVTFSPDGKLVAAAGSDGALRLWSDDLPFEPSALRAWLETAERAGTR